MPPKGAKALVGKGKLQLPASSDAAKNAPRLPKVCTRCLVRPSFSFPSSASFLPPSAFKFHMLLPHTRAKRSPNAGRRRRLLCGGAFECARASQRCWADRGRLSGALDCTGCSSSCGPAQGTRGDAGKRCGRRPPTPAATAAAAFPFSATLSAKPAGILLWTSCCGRPVLCWFATAAAAASFLCAAAAATDAAAAAVVSSASATAVHLFSRAATTAPAEPAAAAAATSSSDPAGAHRRPRGAAAGRYVDERTFCIGMPRIVSVWCVQCSLWFGCCLFPRHCVHVIFTCCICYFAL